MMHRVLLAILAATLLAVPASHAATPERAPVDAVLAGPVQATHDDLFRAGGDADRETRLQDALAGGAYRWALTILAENVAQQRSKTIWQEVRGQPEPYATFATELQEWAVAAREGLEATAARLGEAESSSGMGVADVEALLFAAHYTVQGESSLMRGVSILVSSGDHPDNYDTPTKRYVMAYPLAQATVFERAAGNMLDGFDAHRGGPAIVSTDVLAQVIEDQGGSTDRWPIEEAGMLHRLARHLATYETGLVEPGTARAEVQESIDLLLDRHVTDLQEQGFSGARPLAVALDISWWLENTDPEAAQSSVSHADVTDRMRAASELARYEAQILSAAAPPPAGGPPAWAWWVGGAVLVAAGGALVTYIYVRRGGRSRREGVLSLLVIALVASAGLTGLPHAEAAPAPTEPVLEPHPFSPQDRVSWGTAVKVASDGTVHFAWGECLDLDSSCGEGRMVLRYRNHDPATGTWSEPVTLAQTDGQDDYMPRLLEDGGGIVALWLKGIHAWNRNHPPTQHPAELWSCRVVDRACQGTERLSEVGAGIESFDAVVGSDGHLRVAWAEAAGGDARVTFRQQTGSGWAPPVLFAGGFDQRLPAVTVAKNGTVHVAWAAHIIGESNDVYRVVYHATVDPVNNTASDSDYASAHYTINHGLALAAREGAVHLVYGTEEGMFHRALADGEWSETVNISRSENQVFRPDLVPTGTGVAAVWMELVPGGQGMRLRMAQQYAGLWLAPATVLQPPDRALFVPDMDLDAGGLVHLVWAGDGPDSAISHALYMTVSLELDGAGVEPGVTVRAPLDGSWTKADPVHLRARLVLDAPLDRGGTSWHVDGASVAYQVDGDGLAATLEGLGEGPHDVVLVVRDEAGNQIEERWSFSVDRTPPNFTHAIRNQGGAVVDGWSSSPLRVTGQVHEDGGAPVVLEAQALRVGDDRVVPLEGNATTWTQVPAEGLALPQSGLLEVTVRARDAAGNILLADPFVAGWDDVPPALEFDAPAEWQPADVVIPFRASDGAGPGSPVTVRATFTPLSGSGAPTDHSNTTSDETGGGTVVFPGVVEGAYEVALHVRDEAGNVQENVPGPWRVNVDTTPPNLSVQPLNGQLLRLAAEDDGSGVATVHVSLRGGIPHAEEAGGGAATVVIALGSQPLDGARMVAVDVAGNQVEQILRLEGAGGTLALVDEGDAGQSEGSEPPSPGWSLPIPSVPLVFLAAGLVLTAAWRRR